jgi:diketogulonate reductase-like aldo/keto reductase
VVGAIAAVAKARGVSNAQVALAWLLHQPGVTAPIHRCEQAASFGRGYRGGELKVRCRGIKSLAAPYRPH